MSGYVTDEAVDVAARALDENFNPDRYPVLAAMFSDYARAALEAAAPLIAATALRDAAVRAVTDDARAEAMSRYSFGTYHGQMVQWHDAKKLAVDAFIAGAEWAVARAETTTAGRNGRN